MSSKFYRAVGQLSVAPPAEGLEQMMKAAQALEVRRVCRADRVGHGVVEVAALGGFVAAGEPTRQIAAAHELGRRV